MKKKDFKTKNTPALSQGYDILTVGTQLCNGYSRKLYPSWLLPQLVRLSQDWLSNSRKLLAHQSAKVAIWEGQRHYLHKPFGWSYSSTPFFIKVLFRSRNQSKPSHILSHAPILTHSLASKVLKTVKLGAWEASQKVVKSVSGVNNYIKHYQYQEKIALNIIIGF